MTSDQLAQALLQAVRAQHFEATADAQRGGAALNHFPSLDLAVIAFPANAAPVWANVLFSRDHPQGLVAAIGAAAGAVRNIGYLADRTDAQWRSDAWLPDSLLGLTTLRLAGTRGDGGWGNTAGAGVGQLQMTAWDSARLLWLLDADAPPAPWLGPGAPALVSADCRARLRGWLEDQALHEVLSSTALAGVPGWVHGLPARLPARWIAGDGSVQVSQERAFPADVRPVSQRAEVRFAHKTGTTENYASDAGIVRGIAPRRRHYIAAVTSNLGTRYAACVPCATTWRMPALGAAVDAAVAPWLEARA